ncbi:unnamed protein product, partial [Meganyctiphanes norvegica]
MDLSVWFSSVSSWKAFIRTLTSCHIQIQQCGNNAPRSVSHHWSRERHATQKQLIQYLNNLPEIHINLSNIKCCSKFDQSNALLKSRYATSTQSPPSSMLVQSSRVKVIALQMSSGVSPALNDSLNIMLKDFPFPLKKDEISLTQSLLFGVPTAKYCFDFVEVTTGPPNDFHCCQDNFYRSEIIQNSCSFHEVLYPILMAFSCFFLILTLAVYAGVPTLRGNSSGRLVTAWQAIVSVFYLVRLSDLLYGIHSCGQSNSLTFLMHVNGLAIFFWLNVMAFELWMTVRSQSPVLHSMKKFMKYSLYAWGCSLLIGLVTVVIDFLPQTASFEHLLRPKLAGNTCFLEGKLERWAYLYWVILAITVINMCFFLHICYTIHKSKATVKKRGNHFWLFAKMFLIMGLTWILDIFSTRDCYWVIGDIFNLLQGVFIFIATVCNRTVFKEVLNRLSPRFHGLGDFWQNVSKKVSTHTAAPPSTAITATASSALIFSKDSSGHQYRHSLGKGVDQSINKCGQDNYTVMSLDNNRGFTSATNEVKNY